MQGLNWDSGFPSVHSNCSVDFGLGKTTIGPSHNLALRCTLGGTDASPLRNASSSRSPPIRQATPDAGNWGSRRQTRSMKTKESTYASQAFPLDMALPENTSDEERVAQAQFRTSK